MCHCGLHHSQTIQSLEEYFGFPFLYFVGFVKGEDLLRLDEILVVIGVEAFTIIGEGIVFLVVRNGGVEGGSGLPFGVK